jgi:hypothetical protein
MRLFRWIGVLVFVAGCGGPASGPTERSDVISDVPTKQSETQILTARILAKEPSEFQISDIAELIKGLSAGHAARQRSRAAIKALGDPAVPHLVDAWFDNPQTPPLELRKAIIEDFGQPSAKAIAMRLSKSDESVIRSAGTLFRAMSTRVHLDPIVYRQYLEALDRFGSIAWKLEDLELLRNVRASVEALDVSPAERAVVLEKELDIPLTDEELSPVLLVRILTQFRLREAELGSSPNRRSTIVSVYNRGVRDEEESQERTAVEEGKRSAIFDQLSEIRPSIKAVEAMLSRSTLDTDAVRAVFAAVGVEQHSPDLLLKAVEHLDVLNGEKQTEWLATMLHLEDDALRLQAATRLKTATIDGAASDAILRAFAKEDKFKRPEGERIALIELAPRLGTGANSLVPELTALAYGDETGPLGDAAKQALMTIGDIGVEASIASLRDVELASSKDLAALRFIQMHGAKAKAAKADLNRLATQAIRSSLGGSNREESLLVCTTLLKTIEAIAPGANAELYATAVNKHHERGGPVLEIAWEGLQKSGSAGLEKFFLLLKQPELGPKVVPILVEVGKPALPRLIHIVENGDVRSPSYEMNHAIQSLQGMGPTAIETFDRLVEIADLPIPNANKQWKHTSLMAFRALADIEPVRAADVYLKMAKDIEKVLASQKKPNTLQPHHEAAVVQLGKTEGTTAEALTLLARLAVRDGFEHRDQAQSALAEIGAPAATVVPALRKRLASLEKSDSEESTAEKDRLADLILRLENTASDARKVAANFRKWTDGSGKFSVEAKIVGIRDGVAELKKRDGTTIRVPIDRLSARDRQIISAAQASP